LLIDGVAPLGDDPLDRPQKLNQGATVDFPFAQ